MRIRESLITFPIEIAWLMGNYAERVLPNSYPVTTSREAGGYRDVLQLWCKTTELLDHAFRGLCRRIVRSVTEVAGESEVSQFFHFP